MSSDIIKILLIDDDPGAFTFIRHMLSVVHAQVQVDWVSDFDKGLAALLADEHDVYLIDYYLGGTDGGSLIRKAHELDIDPTIILLTAYGTYDLDVEAMHLGAMEYLDKKHLTAEILERSIRYALERKRVERELKRLNERVAALEELKTEMVRIAAHDLKNPLTSIMLKVYVLKQVVGQDERTLELVGSIEQYAQKMQNIVSSILSLERIEELYKSSLNPLEMGDLVASVFRDCCDQANQKGQTLTLEVPDEPVPVIGDAVLLTLAVTNLVDNALKYTPEGGQVIVRLKKRANAAVLEVEDTGPGIAPEYQEKVFQPFFRVQGATYGAGGSGLGLHLLKTIVLRHNGSILLRSVEGQGSLFGFTLPLQTAATTP